MRNCLYEVQNNSSKKILVKKTSGYLKEGNSSNRITGEESKQGNYPLIIYVKQLVEY